MESRPSAIALQECWKSHDDMMGLKIAEYRPVAATEGMSTSAGTRRGSVLLVDKHIVVQRVDELSRGDIELIGTKIVGDSTTTLDHPFDLWSAYCGPNTPEATIFVEMLEDLVQSNIGRGLLVGDMNARYQPPRRLENNRPASDPCAKIWETLDRMEEEGDINILNDYGTPTSVNGTTIDLVITMGDWDNGFAVPIDIDLISTHYPVLAGVTINQERTHHRYVQTPKILRTKESADDVARECKRLNTQLGDYTQDTLAQAALNMFRTTRVTRKRNRKKRDYWNEELQEVFDRKKVHLAEFGRDTAYKDINDELQKKINEAKNAKFREFASGLDHTNRNVEVFHAIKNISVRPPSTIAQLALRDKSGNVVADIQQKADILAKQYQIPLGHHPSGRERRQQMLKARRETREAEARRLEDLLDAMPSSESTEMGGQQSGQMTQEGSDAVRPSAAVQSSTADPSQQLSQHRLLLEGVDASDLTHKPFTMSEARIAREQMSNNKAPGHSGIRKEDLEMGGIEMEKLMANLGDKVIHAKEWPKPFKTNGIDIPIPKDQEAVDMIEQDQTRPITLLETMDKWLQKMIYNRIRGHVRYHETQAGYSLSCDHHTTVVTDFVLNRKNKPYVIAIFTDIAKAFDSIPLEELIDAIWASAIPLPYKWVLASFVENREYRVAIRDADGKIVVSDLIEKIYGSPEGSILGPLLWNIFFDPLLHELSKKNPTNGAADVVLDVVLDEEDNQAEVTTTVDAEEAGNTVAATAAVTAVTATRDTPALISPEADLRQIGEEITTEVDEVDPAFADDLALLAAAEDPQEAERCLEAKLQIFATFLQARGMEAAPNKLKAMCLDPHGRDYKPTVRYQGETIAVVEEHKFLGVILDKDMNFIKHWEMVTKAVTGRMKTIKCLRSASWGPTQQTIKVLHHSYVESRISYGILAWYPFLDDWHKKELEKLLLQSIRVTIGLPIVTQNIALRAEADLDSVLDLAQKRAVSFFSRINPEDKSNVTLAKRHFWAKLPIWTTLLVGCLPTELPKDNAAEPKHWSWRGRQSFEGIPISIWGGPIQTSLPHKNILTSPTVCVIDRTLFTQEEAEHEEAKHKRILYTDASVDISSNPPGLAATGYIWFERINCLPPCTEDDIATSNATSNAATNVEWTEIARGSAFIGYDHSSYSAEAIAIRIGLNSEPAETIGTNAEVKSVGVFTDSLSNLCTIRGGLATTQEQETLLESIMKYPKEITFHHVKAHHKITRNNQVDALCNVARNDPSRQDRSDLRGAKTVAKIKDWVKRHLSKQRLAAPLKPALLEESSTGKWIAKYVSKSGTTMHPRPKHYNLLPRREGILLAKARTYRWTNCMWLLRKIEKISCDSCRGAKSWKSVCTVCESCTFCGVKDDTEHVLNSCNLHEQSRTALLEKRGYVSKVTDLLTSDDAAETKELTLFLVEADNTRKAMCAARGI